jgi:hypothetical protein
MASSGRMQGNSLSISGYSPQYYFVDWQLASQNTTNNTSTINWQNYFHFTSADAQLDNGDVVAGGATRYDVPGRVYNYSGNFTTRDQAISSGSFTVTHNADGTYTLSVSGAIDVYSTGTSSGSTSWALPTIPRYATISTLTYTPITDVGFTITVGTDVTCDLLEYSLDNGSNYTTGFSGDFTSKTVTLSDKPSDTTYQVIVRVRRKDSQLKTTSSMTSVTTLTQNNFMGFM